MLFVSNRSSDLVLMTFYGRVCAVGFLIFFGRNTVLEHNVPLLLNISKLFVGYEIEAYA